MKVTAKKPHHGDNVRRWREWRNINQDVLAEQVGLSQTTLSDYERKEELRPEIVAKIAKALDIPTEAITGVSDGTSINVFSGTWEESALANGNGNNLTFNSIEKIIELYHEKNALYEEKIALYERMLNEKENVIEMLQKSSAGKK